MYNFQTGEPGGVCCNMKQLFWTFAIVLCLGTLVGCSSKDYEPEKPGQVKGYFKINEKTVNLKYGYEVQTPSSSEYYFADKDISKYLTEEDVPNYEFSVLSVIFRPNTYVFFDYKVNPYKGTGVYYECESNVNGDVYSEFGENDYLFLKGSSISMVGNSYSDDEEYFEDCVGSFTVEGFPLYLTKYTRTVNAIEITDLSQIEKLRSLMHKGICSADINH